MDEWLKYLISTVIGAASSGLLVWFRMKSMVQKLKEGDIALKGQEHNHTLRTKIDSEAEWKRIIEYRDNELIRLRDKDEQQEKKITDLYEKHLACQKLGAAQEARLNMLEAKVNKEETV